LADRAEEIGVLATLVGGLGGARPVVRTLPDKAVLLADASLERSGEVFLEASMVRQPCMVLSR
jgi:hypothetical protein